MKLFNGIGELESQVGQHLGYSDWHTVTQEEVNLFAQATRDHQWIHTDPEKAKDGPFGATVAHGYFILALIPVLSWEIYDIAGLKMSLNYGANKVRFPAPVTVGSSIRAGVELLDVTRSEKGAQSITRTTIEMQGSAKPACVVENVAVYIP
jgi:acyl dehydratase